MVVKGQYSALNKDVDHSCPLYIHQVLQHAGCMRGSEESVLAIKEYTNKCDGDSRQQSIIAHSSEQHPKSLVHNNATKSSMSNLHH